MALVDQLKLLQRNAEKIKTRLFTEEATKNALVMPFLQALGYNVFDPDIVVPEFTADVGVKKGEKVDYALKQQGKIIILVECKTCGTDLGQAHFGQLYRYFSVTEAKVGILTNGIDYWFYSDVDEKNRLDTKPFFSFCLDNFSDSEVSQLQAFCIDAFDAENLNDCATVMKYTTQVKNIIRCELEDPSEEMIRILSSKVYQGRYTAAVKDLFSNIVKSAMTETIREMINARLARAISEVNDKSVISSGENVNAPEPEEDTSGIVTTPEEIEAFLIVKSIARRFVAKERIFLRDTKSYCSVLLDDTNRKPIVRFHFDRAQKKISFGKELNDRVDIPSVDAIFDYEERIKTILLSYDSVGDKKGSADARQ